MAFIPIQTRTETAASPADLLSGLPARLRAVLSRFTQGTEKSPEDLLAAQARRAEARDATDRLLRHPR